MRQLLTFHLINGTQLLTFHLMTRKWEFLTNVSSNDTLGNETQLLTFHLMTR
jgi:hypothetical protein